MRWHICFAVSIFFFLLVSTVSAFDPTETFTYSNFSHSRYYGSGDANNDGYNDIISADDLTNVSIFLWNITSGDWNPRIIRKAGNYLTYIRINDVNRDGYNDIVTAGWMSNISILLWNSTMNDWDTPIYKLAGYLVTGLWIGDANNDGQNDIVVTNYGDDTISIILGKFPPMSVILNPILPEIDTDGKIILNWSQEEIATIYYVYRNYSKITSVLGLNPIAAVSKNNYVDTVTLNGTYYYVIVAGNAYGNSSISNCESVQVEISLEKREIPGFNFLLLLIPTIAIITIYSRKKFTLI